MRDLHYWTHICIEAFCAINWDYNGKKDEYHFQMVEKNGSFMKKNGHLRTKKVPNDKYDPNAKRPSKPTFCKKELCYECLTNNCEYLAHTEARRAKKKHNKKKSGKKYNLR